MANGTSPGPDGPTDEQCLKAWDERVGGKSPALVADLFGVSVPTIHRWIRKGRELAAVVEYEEKLASPVALVNLRTEQARQAATTDAVIAWMGEWVEKGGEYDKAALVVLKALERRAAALGTDAPKRAALEVTPGYRPGTAVPAHTAAAIEAYDRGEDPVDDVGGHADQDGEPDQ